MKVTTAYLFLFLLIISNCFSQTTAIPDANFEQKLIDLSIDTNGLNGNILDSDAQAVTNLTLTGNAITNLTGLEAFVNVVTLNLGTNQFATVPLSTLTLLQELVFDQNVVLANLNLSNNVNLKKLDIRANGGTNTAPITLIDLSNNTQLEYIHIYNFKLLQNVIFPTTNTVEYVFLLMFADINVDFSGYDNLETLFLSTNFSNSLTINVVLPNNQTTLKSASFQGGNITNANLSTMLGLTYLSLQQTNTQTLQLPTTNTLKTIRISGHKIDNVNFANSSGLEDLSITNKSVNIPLNIDISQNLLLKKLTATNNYMTNIDVTQNTLLNNINVSSNQLTSLNVDQNILLKDLDAGNNLLPFINLSQNVLLENLDLNNNVIPSLDLTTNVILDFVNISNNLFTTTGLDLTQNVLLTYFKASFNQIESLNISQNAILTRLILDHNLFSGTAILDQFYTLRLNNDGIYFGELDVSFNNLSGVVPNYTSLFHLGTPASTNWTRRFELYINNNNFEFGHFENQHSNYVLATNTYVPTTFTTPVMSNYWYAPQAKVNTIDTINANAGDPITLTTVVSGAQNHYVWFKDGIQISNAPDSPNYVINSVNPCNQGVYYCEILSDLVPFENTNPPGTQGKNLKLTRNDITLNVALATNSCPTLTSPLNGATNVPINPTITWANSPNACSYSISIGTNSGGTQILNNVNVGDVNIYNLTSNLPVNTQIFITITPNYQSGPTPSCTEQSFTTNASVVLPNCTTLVSPSNGSTNVAINSNISWNAIANATGYFISIGTTSGGTNFVNNFDNGNSTTFNPTTDFAQNTQYFVTITPYNSAGNATACASESFTTESIVTIPTCTTVVSPSNGSTNVAINSNISWNAVPNATGYFISIGTTSGGTNFVNNFDNGNSTTFNPTTDFPQNTTYFVTITPYNSAGNATSCASESFTTETIVTIPNCTTLVSPSNGSTNVAINPNISWNSVSNATGYFLSIGTTSGGTQIANMIDIGNLTSYNSGVNFAQNTTYFITITPYNAVGNAPGCIEESFTTETITIAPNCTSLSSPLNNATNVSINSNISWNTSTLATGYFITVGTSPGGGQIENMLNVGNVTTYNPPANAFSQFPMIYVTVIPYNSQGNAIGCFEESFSTELANLIPNCTNLSFPLNGQNSISVDLNSIAWNQPQLSIVDGYFLSIGTTPNGTEIINNNDVGNTTSYMLLSSLPFEATIYVTVIPYNSNGLAIGCSEESFQTIENPEPILFIPSYFTPNGDNNNDNWIIEDDESVIKKISIFDRFGKLLEVLSSNQSWNGTFNNQKLASDDYWFVIEKKTGELLKGHFTLKR